jgi:hypothetical protein
MELRKSSWIGLGVGIRTHFGEQKTAANGWNKSLAFENGRVYSNGGTLEGLTLKSIRASKTAGRGQCQRCRHSGRPRDIFFR